MKMTFDEFKDAVILRILDYLPDSFRGADVSVNVVTKANDERLTGLTIVGYGCNMAPTIYLERFFEQYKNGMDIEDILRKIAEMRLSENKVDLASIGDLLDFDYCRDRLMPRLYGAELNVEAMKDRPHTVIGDFVTFYIVCLDEREDGLISVPVNNVMAEAWNKDSSELHEIAVSNLKKLDKGSFRSMKDVMREIMVPEFLEDIGEDEELGDDFFEDMFPVDNPMYVLTNRKNMNGATMLLNQDLLEEISERIGDGFLILPSSIHEEDGSGLPVKDLEAMVYEINRVQVGLGDRLSDHVYRFTKKDGLVRAA